MADDWDLLVGELRRLRQRQGLTLPALARCSRLLDALGSPPLQEAFDSLVALTEQLGDSEPAVALRQAYAIGMAHPRLLTDRRADLQAATGRDPKTLSGYENQMITELAGRILGRNKAEVSESQVYVIGDIKDGKLQRISVTVRFPPSDDGDAFERTVDYENRSATLPLPALLYQLPPDWRPTTLILGVRVEPADGSLRVWTTASGELLSLMFSDTAQPVPTVDGVGFVQTHRPRPGVMYAIYWERVTIEADERSGPSAGFATPSFGCAPT